MTNLLNKGFCIKIYILMLLLSSVTLVNADPSGNIVTGRPGQSIGAGVVGKSVFQIQSGFEFSESQRSNTSTQDSFINNVIRYGISERVELSSIIDFNNLDDSDSNVGNVQFGGRINIISKSDGFVPQLCFQTRIQFFDGGGDFADKLKFVSIVSGVFDIKEYGAITSNLVISNTAQDDVRLSRMTFSWSQDLTEKIGYFLEYYANNDPQQFDNFIDTGFSYLLNKDTLFDLSVGTDIETSFSSQFISLGISWRKI